jgi:putative ubiquitin-RnfH superfamily antitoxin RatB of RatAB toxin-antitoxin module
MFMENLLEVEVVYAKADRQSLVAVSLESGATVEQAIKASGILEQFAEIDLASHSVGIFGKVCRLSDTVNSGDRVEIYRPLLQNPMDARRKRAAI